MAQTGRRTGKTDFDVYQLGEIDGVADIGRSFEELGRKLAEVAAESADVPDDRDSPDTRLVALRLEQLMEAVAQHRDGLAYWERVIAEYALHRRGYSQRKTAQLLGVGVSTVNRWSQNPAGFDWSETDSDPS